MSIQIKKITLVFGLVLGIAGCASAPPPPECKGEFRPINIMDKNAEVPNNLKIARCGKGELHGNKG
ncbi:MAG: hypothetical protein CVU29_03735 [Betaproteobacteria bacterium HGW-Betaproteobacteria-22]|nr:MAG: hypothetical protein CVU29_03735 [Betaproteobacteria bacterium HGW-Betaproteobacteria-22]